MSMTLRIVIPPHPLIGHWLSILRMPSTPPTIYTTALEQIGKWLTYESLRDWLPHKKEILSTKRGETEGILLKPEIPLLVIPSIPGGLQMWQGAREILPNATLCLGDVPKEIEENAGIIIYCDQIDSGDNLLKTLNKLKRKGIQSPRLRVISSIASNDGLKKIGESFPELRIYTSCIDPLLSEKGEIIPGIGDLSIKLNTRVALSL